MFISDELFNCLINEKHFIKGTKVINLRVSRLKVHVNQDKRKQPFEISESFNDAFHQHQWVYYDYF